MSETKDEVTQQLAGNSGSQSEDKESSHRSPQDKEFIQSTGRRKTAIARVRLKKGSGEFVVNNKPVEEYFSDIINSKNKLIEPLTLVGLDKKFYIEARVLGGGKPSQLDAVKLGIARSLVVYNESLKTTLKKAGLLTRDSRAKERKKYGLKRARKASQFRKR